MLSKVAAVQMVSTVDVDENLATADRLISEAAEQGAELVLLPEVFAVLEGGPMRQYGEVEGTGKLQDFLVGQARGNKLILVGGTIPLISRPGMVQVMPNTQSKMGKFVLPVWYLIAKGSKLLAMTRSTCSMLQ